MALYIILPPIPLYIAFLGIKETLIGLIVGIFTVAAIIARIIAGPYVNRKPKLVLALGSTMFVIAPLFYILSDSLLELFMIRFLHGTGMVFIIATMTLIAKLTPKTKLGEVMGIYGACVGAAQVTGFFFSGIIFEMGGFIGAFYVASGFALISVLAGMSIRGDWIYEDQPNISTGGYLKVLGDQNVRLASFAVILLTLSYGMLITFGPLYLTDLGIPPTYLGMFFALIAIGVMMGRPIAGRLSDTKGRFPVILPTMFLTAISVYALSVFITISSLFLMAILYGLGFGSAYSVQSALVIDTIDSHNRGSALAFFTACFDLGISTGAIGIGFLAGAILFDYSLFFQVTSILLLVGIGILAYLSKQRILLSTD